MNERKKEKRDEKKHNTQKQQQPAKELQTNQSKNDETKRVRSEI